MANPELTGKPSPFDRKARALVRAAAPSHPHRSATQTLARGLGWFSLGLGLAELLAPRLLGRWVGLPGRTGLLQACGAREMAAGIGLLAARRPTAREGWMLARVAGDAIDLSLLAQAAARGARGGHPLVAIAAVAGVTALDLACARTLRHEANAARQTTDYSDRSGLGARGPVAAPGRIRAAAPAPAPAPESVGAMP